MKKALWKLVDLSWLIAFEILLAYAFGIPFIGLLFLPILLLFVKFFSITVEKFGSSWIVWSIPYTLSSVFFLSFFSGMNPFLFTFKAFWLNLASWFSGPLSNFALASMFFAISYVIGYLTAHLLKETLNTFLVLSVSAIIAGIATQYCCLPISFGFMVLFAISFLLSLNVEKMRLSRTFAIFFVVAISIGVLFFFVGTLSHPFTPFESFIPIHSSQSTNTSVATNHTGNVHPLARRTPIPLPNSSHRKIYVSQSGIENMIFNIIIYIVGISIMSLGAFFIVAFFKVKGTRKKLKWKNVMWIIWMIISVFFVIMMLLYTFHVAGNALKVPKVNFQFQPRAMSLPFDLPHNNDIARYIGSRNSGLQTGNPIFWITLAVIGLVIFLYMIFRFLKDMTPSYGKKASHEEKENVLLHEEKEEKLEPNAKPWQKVLFYYNMLRRKVGNPSSTPYEFERDLKKKIEDENVEKATNIFIKLRYAHQEISEKDAAFMEEWVTSTIKKLT